MMFPSALRAWAYHPGESLLAKVLLVVGCIIFGYGVVFLLRTWGEWDYWGFERYCRRMRKKRLDTRR